MSSVETSPAMAACQSLQHIFENPLPDNPTLLETLSSWNQIMPVKPIEQSSFTEIFGELHFKEPSLSSSPLSLTDSIPPPTFENVEEEENYETDNGSEFNSPYKEPFSNFEYSTFHRRSNSFSSTNSESLQLCTEGLGFESFDDVEDLKGGMDEEVWQRQEDTVTFENHFHDQHQSLKPEITRKSRLTTIKDFPPPISCLGKSGKHWVGFKSYRYDGRVILKEIRVPTHEFLHAHKENGRLILHILAPNEESFEEDNTEDDDGDEKGVEE